MVPKTPSIEKSLFPYYRSFLSMLLYIANTEDAAIHLWSYPDNESLRLLLLVTIELDSLV